MQHQQTKAEDAMPDTNDPLSALLSANTAELSYEQAREGLVLIINRLEEGRESLERSLQLWEKGEELAKRCGEWLDAAQARIDAATAPQVNPTAPPSASAEADPFDASPF